MTNQDDLAGKIRELQKKLTNARSEEEKDLALDELHRLGKTISAEDLKAIVACGCGPQGERGIESWPCVRV